MKDTTAFDLLKILKVKGHDVKCSSAPSFVKGSEAYLDGSENLAVIGSGALSPSDVKACTDAIRKRLMRECEAYTLDISGTSRHFPGAAFAAW